MAGLKEFTLLLCYPSTTALVATGRLCFFFQGKSTPRCVQLTSGAPCQSCLQSQLIEFCSIKACSSTANQEPSAAQPCHCCSEQHSLPLYILWSPGSSGAAKGSSDHLSGNIAH